MGYQVWTKTEFEGWQKEDCSTLDEAKGAIMLALQTGREPLLTQEVGYEISLKIREGEVSPGKSRAKSKAPVETEKKEEETIEAQEDTAGSSSDTGG